MVLLHEDEVPDPDHTRLSAKTFNFFLQKTQRVKYTATYEARPVFDMVSFRLSRLSTRSSSLRTESLLSRFMMCDSSTCLMML